MPTKLRKEHCLQQTWLQYATAENYLILYKNVCILARWSTNLDAHHILHTDAWLRGEYYGKCCSISCNSDVLLATNWLKHHKICFHVSVFLIRPTPTHNNILQIILKISIFWFADPTIYSPVTNLYQICILYNLYVSFGLCTWVTSAHCWLLSI